MNLTKLKYFIELAECKNITQTAAKLYIAQSNLSKQISQFEAEVGVRLFDRTHSGVELTAAGLLVYDKLKHVPDLIENTFAQARDLKNGFDFRLGILEGFDFTRERFLALQTMFPEHHFTIERRSVEELRIKLMEGNYDAVITLDFDLAEYGLTSEPIKPLDMGLLISSENPICEKLSGSGGLQALNDAVFVCVDPQQSPASYRMAQELCRFNGLSPKRFFFVENYEDMLLSVETYLTVGVQASNNGLRAKAEIRTIPVPAPDTFKEVLCWEPSNRNKVIPGLLQVMRENP